MEKIPTWKISRSDLLARLYNLLYVIPPAVKIPLRQKESLIYRMNLPQARGKKFGVRARDIQELDGSDTYANPCSGSDAGPADPGGAAASPDGEIVLEAEADPARRSTLATGPGLLRQLIGASAKSGTRSNLLKFRKHSRIHGSTIQNTQSESDCVLGVLPCGYVLSGSGSIKTLSRK